MLLCIHVHESFTETYNNFFDARHYFVLLEILFQVSFYYFWWIPNNAFQINISKIVLNFPKFWYFQEKLKTSMIYNECYIILSVMRTMSTVTIYLIFICNLTLILALKINYFLTIFTLKVAYTLLSQKWKIRNNQTSPESCLFAWFVGLKRGEYG